MMAKGKVAILTLIMVILFSAQAHVGSAVSIVPIGCGGVVNSNAGSSGYIWLCTLLNGADICTGGAYGPATSYYANTPCPNTPANVQPATEWTVLFNCSPTSCSSPTSWGTEPVTLTGFPNVILGVPVWPGSVGTTAKMTVSTVVPVNATTSATFNNWDNGSTNATRYVTIQAGFVYGVAYQATLGNGVNWLSSNCNLSLSSSVSNILGCTILLASVGAFILGGVLGGAAGFLNGAIRRRRSD